MAGTPRPAAPRSRVARAPAALAAHVQRTLTELVGISSVSGREDEVRAYLRARLEQLQITTHTDAAGNLIAAVTGIGTPLLLNAHMDRVPPGRGHVPHVVAGRMFGDGTTNLGADDCAGLAIVLETLRALTERERAHRPVVVLFTVGEEVGLRGATAFDPSSWQVHEGMVFDNAGAAGDVVTHGATYVAFDAVLRGRGGHPGKDLTETVSAIEIFRRLPLPHASLDGDTTRFSIGTVAGGSARNAIAGELRLAGEVRTLLRGGPLLQLLASIEQDVLETAQQAGGSAQCTFEPHGAGYTVAHDEPLLLAWQRAWVARGHQPATITSFIGSDTNALRKRLRVFTVSTGVEHEHSLEESIALAPLAELVETTLTVLASPSSASSPT